jgi:hypothetical protein
MHLLVKVMKLAHMSVWFVAFPTSTTRELAATSFLFYQYEYHFMLLDFIIINGDNNMH